MEKRYKNMLLVIWIIITCFLLNGCEKNGFRSQEQIKEEKEYDAFLDYLLERDSFSYQEEKLNIWMESDKQSYLDSIYNKVPAQVDYIRATLNFVNSDYEKAEKMYLQAISAADSDTETEIKARSYYELTRIMNSQEKYDIAFEYIDKIQELYEKKSDKRYLIRINSFLGYDLTDMPNGVEKCISLLKATEDMMTEDTDYTMIEQIYYSLANAYSYAGDYVNCINCSIKAYRIAKEKNDYYWCISIANMIGANYVEEGDYNKAESYLQQALSYYNQQQSKKPAEAAYLYDSLAEVYGGLKRYYDMSNALENENKYIMLEEEGKEKEDDLTNYYLSLAGLKIALGQIDEAIELLHLTEERYYKDDYFYYSNFDTCIYECFGEAYLKAGQYEKSLEYYDVVRKNYARRGMGELPIADNENIYKCYKALNNEKKAFSYAEKLFEQLKKQYSLQEEQSAAIIAEQFEAEEREKEISNSNFPHQ